MHLPGSPGLVVTIGAPKKNGEEMEYLEKT
jgi:hypothetical protein